LRRLRFLALLTGVFISGCSLFGGHAVEARIPTAGKKLSLIPFREKDLYYLESAAGAEMAALVQQVILKEAPEVRIVDSTPALQMLQDKNPDSINWGAVAKKLKVDYIVIGNILTYRAKDPKDRGCYRGRMVVQVTVMRPDNSIALTETVSVSHPSGRFSAPVISPLDSSEKEILTRLQVKMAKAIGKFFYAYTPEED